MVRDLIERLARALERAGLPYMVIGGQAVLLYGEPRVTKDVDITLGVGPEQLPVLKPVCASILCFLSRRTSVRRLSEHGGLPLARRRCVLLLRRTW